MNLVAKHHIIEMGFCKRMFNADKKVEVKAIMNKYQNEVEFIINQECGLDKSKEFIASKLK